MARLGRRSGVPLRLWCAERVVAGDPPIDYATVTKFRGCSELDPACLEHSLQGRDTHFADVVAREVIAQDRTALLIAGLGHMRRAGEGLPMSVPELLEADHGATTVVVIPHVGFGAADPDSEARFAGWPVPGLARLAGSWLGALDACLLEADVGHPPVEPCDGGPDARRSAMSQTPTLYLGEP